MAETIDQNCFFGIVFTFETETPEEKWTAKDANLQVNGLCVYEVVHFGFALLTICLQFDPQDVVIICRDKRVQISVCVMMMMMTITRIIMNDIINACDVLELLL